MQAFKELLKDLLSASFSNPRRKLDNGLKTVAVRKLKAGFQITEQLGAQSFHRNIQKEQAVSYILELPALFKQGVVRTSTNDHHLLFSKKGDVKILSRPAKNAPSLEHNRQKQHLIPEGSPLLFLQELGVMDSSGRILAKKRDKFIQINKFLEIVVDCMGAFDAEKPLAIVDFGCGKSYLTFALYYYLSHVLGFSVSLTGFDLKASVIDACNALAKKLHFTGLKFVCKAISPVPCDLCVALHACDTATDAAIAAAIQGGASVILCAPCCQHELYAQVKAPALEGLLKYGILKERFSALATDALRGLLLEAEGFRVQLLEFIDSAHTPKNILIRAIKTKSKGSDAEYAALRNFLSAHPSLEKMLRSAMKQI